MLAVVAAAVAAAADSGVWTIRSQQRGTCTDHG